MLPSGNLLHSYWQSSFLMGKLTINHHFQQRIVSHYPKVIITRGYSFQVFFRQQSGASKSLPRKATAGGWTWEIEKCLMHCRWLSTDWGGSQRKPLGIVLDFSFSIWEHNHHIWWGVGGLYQIPTVWYWAHGSWTYTWPSDKLIEWGFWRWCDVKYVG